MVRIYTLCISIALIVNSKAAFFQNAGKNVLLVIILPNGRVYDIIKYIIYSLKIVHLKGNVDFSFIFYYYSSNSQVASKGD